MRARSTCAKMLTELGALSQPELRWGEVEWYSGNTYTWWNLPEGFESPAAWYRSQWRSHQLNLDDLRTLSDLMRSCALAHLTVLHLGTPGTYATDANGIHIGHNIGDNGVAILADGLGSGQMMLLKELNLAFSDIGEDGASSLAAAFANGALTNLERLDLDANPIRAAGVAALANAFGSLSKLSELRMGAGFTHAVPRDRRAGEAGSVALADALGKGALPCLKKLLLGGFDMGDAGAEALLRALAEPLIGGLPRKFEWLTLTSNKLTRAAMLAFASILRIPGTLPKLQDLTIDDNEEAERYCELVNDAWREAGRGEDQFLCFTLA